MNNRNAPSILLTLHIALAILSLIVSPVTAHANIGSDWLASQFQTDGSIAADADAATAYQSTAETLRYWQMNGEGGRSVVPAALQYLETNNYGGTEYLSRLIVAKAEAGNGVTDLVTGLLAYANSDGGFGEQSGYGSTSLDTAFALHALQSSGQGNVQQAYAAVGFLLAAQRDDGGWSSGDNDSDVYVTGQALLALVPYVATFTEVPGAIQAAQSFLFSQRDINGLWGEDHQSAVVLIALKSSMTDGGSLQADIDALKNRQGSDGGWSGDVYATALALRLLALADKPIANPSLSALQGRIVDGDTGHALAGVQVLLQGTTAAETQSDADGNFLFSDLPSGAYTVTLNLSGYDSLIATVSLAAGKITDLGALNLLRTTTNTDTATIRGTVTDAISGQPLAGVTITTGAQSVITGTDGSFQLNGVAPGSITVSAGGCRDT